MTESGLPLEGAFHPTRNLEIAASAVIFLHGFGASGDDLIDFSGFLAGSLPDTVFYAPDAPEPCEVSPFGRQWFSMDDHDPGLLRRAPAPCLGRWKTCIAASKWRRRAWIPSSTR